MLVKQQPSYAVGDTRKQRKNSKLAANNDLDAINTWLAAKTANSRNTFASYRKEATRFLMYLGSQGLALQDVKAEHMMQYLNILESPPYEWLVPTDSNSVVYETQCLKMPLGKASLRHTRTVLKSLFTFLSDAQYINGNPVSLTRSIRVRDEALVEKALVVDAWSYLWQWLVKADENSTEKTKLTAARNRFMCAVLYHTGMRLSSLTSTTMAGFSRKKIHGERVWHLSFIAKGSKLHTVIVNPILFGEVVRYRRAIGLPDEPNPDETTPLVRAQKRDVKLSSRGVQYVLEELLLKAVLDCDDPHIISALKKVSPHTFRHTFATHSLLSGASLQATQKNLAHASIVTTTIYAKVLDDEMLDASQEFGKFAKNLQKP